MFLVFILSVSRATWLFLTAPSLMIVSPRPFLPATCIPANAEFYKADFSDWNVAGTFSIAVPSKSATKTSQFRLTTAGSVNPPLEVTLNAKTPVVLGALGKNLQCSQVAPSVWDCFGQTKLTQADINSIGFTAGVGVRVDSHDVSLTYPDARNQAVDATSKLAKATSTKMDQVFGKTDLLLGVPAGRFQAVISGDEIKGGAMFVVSNLNRKTIINYSIILISPEALTPEATLTVLDPATQESIIIPVACKWAQPRPGVHVCEAKGDFPTAIDTVFSTTSLQPAAAARSAAASMRAAALPGSAVDLVFKVTVASGMMEESVGTLRYSL
ncbi:unnamed protein product [Closterium sp. Yama58-4]|nr:unnamed protein product [Closterium sp. Yama58-4]